MRYLPSELEYRSHIRLLDRHRGAGFFQLLLELLGVFLGDAFLDLAGHAFDQILGFLQAQARQLREPP